jgi:hypothetical protein
MQKVYTRSTKHGALTLLGLLSLCAVAAPAIPTYWYWEKLSARADVFPVLLIILAWGMWNWFTWVIRAAKDIMNLPEPNSD